MALADLLAAEPAKGRPCKVVRVIPATEHDALAELLAQAADPDHWRTWVGLQRDLRAQGFDLSDSSIRDHHRGACTCTR